MFEDRQIDRYRHAVQENCLAEPRRCLLCHEPDNLNWHGGYPRSLIKMTPKRMNRR
jgi:hypothetical protein